MRPENTSNKPIRYYNTKTDNINYSKMKKFFSAKPKGGRRTRRTGYYWVHWHNQPDGSKYERIGYYYDAMSTWVLPGETRYYFDEDLLGIDERRISRYGFPFHTRLLADINLVWALVLITIIIYKLITS